MSFTLVRCNNKGNVMADYRTIAHDFCLEYYTKYDENVESLRKMYYSNSLFLYLEHEIMGFDSWISALRFNNYNNFTHNDMSVSVMPVSDTNLLVTVCGNMVLNNHINENKFIENILLQKSNNSFFICATMFKFLD